MKSRLFLITFLLNIFLFAQENYNHFIYTITSGEKMEQNSNDQKIKMKEIFDVNEPNIEYELFYDNGKTFFTPITKLNNSQSSLLSLNKIFIDTKGEYYYDEQSNLIENSIETFNKKYIIESSYNEIPWIRTNQTKIIADKTCKIAYYQETQPGTKEDRNYVYTVCFVEDFDKNIAPFGLTGLQGIVLEIDFNGFKKATLTEMKSSKTTKKIKPFTKGEKISKQEHNKIIEDFFLRRRERMNQTIE